MNKYISVALVALALVGAGCYKKTTNTNSSGSLNTTLNDNANISTNDNANVNSNTLNTNASNSNTNASISTTTRSVSIANFAFSPTNLTVTKGDQVKFINNDSTAHTVTANAFGGAHTVSAGSSYTLDTSTVATGTYSYTCDFHGSMNATLIVQ